MTALYFGSTDSAYGYIDPGAGSYILQAIAAMTIGAFIGIRVFWTKIREFIEKVLDFLKVKK